jgi:hypothetical protein
LEVTVIRQVKIPIRVRNGTVICGRVGGNVRLRPGDEIRWTIGGKRRFQLEFFHVNREDHTHPRGALRRWPFGRRAPASFRVGPTRKFVGRIAASADGLEYKYYVTVLPDHLRLDPIIIIGH